MLSDFWTLGTYTNHLNEGAKEDSDALAKRFLQKEMGIKYQALHHIMVASSMVNKIAHKINPNMMMGTMLALSGIYPKTCHLEDFMGAMQFRRRTLIFADVMMRGYYPSYT